MPSPKRSPSLFSERRSLKGWAGGICYAVARRLSLPHLALFPVKHEMALLPCAIGIGTHRSQSLQMNPHHDSPRTSTDTIMHILLPLPSGGNGNIPFFGSCQFHARGTGIPVCGWSDLHVDEIMLFCCPVDGRCTTITACRSRLVFQSLTQNVLDRSDEGMSPSPCSYTVYSKVHVLVLDRSRPNNRRVTI